MNKYRILKNVFNIKSNETKQNVNDMLVSLIKENSFSEELNLKK